MSRRVLRAVAEHDFNANRNPIRRRGPRFEHEVASVPAETRIPAVVLEYLTRRCQAFQRHTAGGPIEHVDIAMIVCVRWGEPRVRIERDPAAIRAEARRA